MAARRALAVLRVDGLLPYSRGLELQQAAANLVHDGAMEDTLILLQHPHTYTLGKRATAHNLLVDESGLAALGAELHQTARGGDVTYHGPGQLVAYPIVDLRRLGVGVRAFVERLEDAAVAVAASCGVAARGRVPDQTGVWVQDRKLAQIGIQVSRGVSSHGLALNVAPDLRFFDRIVPCGIPDKAVTSLVAEAAAGAPGPLHVVRGPPGAWCAADEFEAEFARLFGYSDVRAVEGIVGSHQNEPRQGLSLLSSCREGEQQTVPARTNRSELVPT